jgi:hypothetical protein
MRKRPSAAFDPYANYDTSLPSGREIGLDAAAALRAAIAAQSPFWPVLAAAKV